MSNEAITIAVVSGLTLIWVTAITFVVWYSLRFNQRR